MARSLIGAALGLLLAALLVAAGADAASAATVRLVENPITGDTAVAFAAAGGERNDVSVSTFGPSVNVQDLVGNPIAAVPPCSPFAPGLGTAAVCPAADVDLVTVDLGDGNDAVTLAMASLPSVLSGGDGRDRFFGGRDADVVSGGAGDDRLDGWDGRDVLDGGPGTDELLGGEGGDELRTRDGARDDVSCGGGADVVIADASDAAAADCEQIERGPPVAARPSAVTVAAADVTATSATLIAVVNPNNTPTRVAFELGRTPAYGLRSAETSLPAGSVDGVVRTLVTGLAPAAVYHFRVVAVNEAGTTVGADATFVTASAPRRCVVPNVRGRWLRAARAALGRAGCRVGAVRRVFAPARSGTVVAQAPRPGAVLRPDAPVTLVVSRGRRR